MRGIPKEASGCIPGAEAFDDLSGLGMSIATSPGELLARRRSESALLGLLPVWDMKQPASYSTEHLGDTIQQMTSSGSRRPRTGKLRAKLKFSVHSEVLADEQLYLPTFSHKALQSSLQFIVVRYPCTSGDSHALHTQIKAE